MSNAAKLRFYTRSMSYHCVEQLILSAEYLNPKTPVILQASVAMKMTRRCALVNKHHYFQKKYSFTPLDDSLFLLKF